MNGFTYLACVLLTVVAICQIAVSIIIWRADEFEKNQRVCQLLIIWLIPIFGALACHFFLQSQRSLIQLKRHEFVQQESNVEVGFGDVKP
jgi:hypothetical protein